MEWGEPEPHCPLVSGAGAGGLTPSGTARGHQQRPGHAPQLWAPSPRACVLRVLPGEGSIKDVTAAFGFQPSLLPTGLPFFPGWGGLWVCLSPVPLGPSGSHPLWMCTLLPSPPCEASRSQLGSCTPWTTNNKSLARAPPVVLQLHSTPPEPCVPGIMTQAGVMAENAREDK